MRYLVTGLCLTAVSNRGLLGISPFHLIATGKLSRRTIIGDRGMLSGEARQNLDTRKMNKLAQSSDSVFSNKILAMIVSLRHLLGRMVRDFRSQKGPRPRNLGHNDLANY